MDSDSSALTALQHLVLQHLTAGASLHAAAAKAGVDLKTIAGWRRTSPAFRERYRKLRDPRTVVWREELLALAPAALERVRQTIVDRSVPEAVGLRAALAVLEKVLEFQASPLNPPPDNVIAMPLVPARPAVVNAKKTAFAERLKPVARDVSET